MDNLPLTTLQNALNMAKEGFSVFLLKPRDKTPMASGWQERATTDSEAITREFLANPQANYGVAAGNELVVIDIDGPDGEENIVKLEGQYGPLPKTLTVKTGKGKHLYYNSPLANEIKNSVSKLAEHIDVRTKGGYVVGPGSTHPSGVVYTIVDFVSPALLPEEWLKLMLGEKLGLPQKVAVSEVGEVPESVKRYGLKALENQCDILEKIPDRPGKRQNSLNTAIFSIGTLAEQCGLDKGEVRDAFSTATSHWQDDWDHWEFMSTFTRAWGDGLKKPRDLSHLSESTRNKRDEYGSCTHKGEVPKIQTITACELLKREFAPTNWVIPNFLPEGLTIFAGKPKAGKSWLALGVSIAAVTRTTVMDSLPITKGTVLYMALEDNDKRLQHRIQCLEQDDDRFENLHLTTEMPFIGNGGIEALEAWLLKHPDCKLIVIDTLARVKPPNNSRGNAYEQDYHFMAPLQTLALEKRIAIVVITHLRKQEAQDPFDQIMGSLGGSSVADCLWVLNRDRNQDEGKLFITGRDIEDRVSALRFNQKDCTWSYLGHAEKVFMSEERRKILVYLEEIGQPIGPKAVSEGTGLSNESVRHLLAALITTGHVQKIDRGKYISISKDENLAFGHSPQSLRSPDSLSTEFTIEPTEVIEVIDSQNSHSPFNSFAGDENPPQSDRGE